MKWLNNFQKGELFNFYKWKSFKNECCRESDGESGKLKVHCKFISHKIKAWRKGKLFGYYLSGREKGKLETWDSRSRSCKHAWGYDEHDDADDQREASSKIGGIINSNNCGGDKAIAGKNGIESCFYSHSFHSASLAGGRRWCPNPQPSRSWWSARRMVIINAASAAAAAQNNKMTSNTSWTSKQAAWLPGRQAAGLKITPYAPPIVVVVPMPLFHSLAPCPYTSFHRRSPFKKYFHIKNRVFSSSFCPALA